MNIPGVGGWQNVRSDSWFDRTTEAFRSRISTSNLIGLIGAAIALFMLIALPEPWDIRLPLYLIVLVLSILRPRTALYLMPFAVPWGSLDVITVAGLNLNSADVLVAFLTAGWLMSFTLRPIRTQAVAGPCDHDRLQVPRYLILATVGLLCVMILSMIDAISISSSLKEISKWIEFLVLILIGSQYIRTRKQLWTIVVLICLAGITQAFYGYIQYFFNLGPEAFVRDASLRVYGTFGQPNPFAGYINMPLSITIAVFLLGRDWITRTFALLGTALLLAAELLSKSRGGEIALAATVLFIVIVGMPRLRPIASVVAIIGLGVLGVFLTGWVPDYVFLPIQKLLGTSQISFTAPSAADYSTAERLAHWIAGIHMFIDHPILGVGIGNYPDAYPQYYITIFVNSLGHAHNYYINIAAETGFIGLIAFLLFLMAIFFAGGDAYQIINQKYRKAKAQQVMPQPNAVAPLGVGRKLYLLLHPIQLVQYYRKQETLEIQGKLTNDRVLAIGLLAALLSVCVHNMVDDLYVHSLTNLIALLLIALIRLAMVTPNVEASGG
jgi:O-antigen ligase